MLQFTNGTFFFAVFLFPAERPWHAILLVGAHNTTFEVDEQCALLAARLARNRLPCSQTCPYIQPLRSGGDKVKKLMPLTRKKVDDVLGGDKAWEIVDQTDAVCEACGNKRAYFMQIQIRSADEPMTIFYKCTACKKVWSA